MQTECKTEDQEPSYDNLDPTIRKSKQTPNTYGIRQIAKKPVFKWTAVATIFTIMTIIIVVPTILEVTKQDSINGNWGNWTSFSDCSYSCGGGTQYRVRYCDHPNPAFGGMWCEGNKTFTQFCHTHPCPVHGSWGNWRSFSECSQSCGGGIQTRYRQCDSPIPEYGGDYCSKNENETRPCNTEACPVQGNWGSWTDVSGCSHSCGGGTKYRFRMCNNPSPSFGGKWCTGNATKFQKCNENTCTDYKSAFTVYGVANGPTPGTIRFTKYITNIGSHYDTSTGQFTCRYPGIYVFSFQLYKDTNDDVAHCYIRKNGSNQLLAYSQRGRSDDTGCYESSNTLVIHLDRGDIVYLGSCTEYHTILGSVYTTFSGYLLKAD